MPRPQGTQTRTFVYTGADMTSVTNPENGTVTYTYDATHHVTSRTDAKGQQTQYTYDGYGRVTEVQYYPQQGWEDMNQRVNYTYDQGQYGMGRLTGVQFGGNDYWHSMTFSYAYSYNQAGRVITQGMSSGWANLTATYQWDTEGRMTQIGYPGLGFWYSPPGPLYALQYDNMGRLNGMTEDLQNGSGPQPAASAGYGPAGEMVNLSYFGVNETRTYNSLLQLTRMTANLWGANVMDMQYNYSATQNNGRISISNDYVTGENVTYGYDAVNRLTGASAGSMWGEAYSYDGFGNLTGKTVTQSPAPAMGVSYDANNHQLGLSYDANGNQMADAQNATFYWWDVENRLVMSESNGWPGAETWYAYDPWGKRVMKDVNADPYDNGYWGGSWEFYFYGITGQKLALELHAVVQRVLRGEAGEVQLGPGGDGPAGERAVFGWSEPVVLPVWGRADSDLGRHGEIRDVPAGWSGAGLRGAEILQQWDGEILECGSGRDEDGEPGEPDKPQPVRVCEWGSGELPGSPRADCGGARCGGLHRGPGLLHGV
jgi:YD repeat-containing protein